MAQNRLTVKLDGLEEFKEEAEKLTVTIEKLSETVRSLPWYVRMMLAFGTAFRLKEDKDA